MSNPHEAAAKYKEMADNGRFAPGETPLELFMQDVWWTTKDGRTLRLTEMEPGHRKNVLAMLRRKMVGRDPNLNSETQKAQLWLEKQPLVRRLVELVEADDLGLRPVSVPHATQVKEMVAMYREFAEEQGEVLTSMYWDSPAF